MFISFLNLAIPFGQPNTPNTLNYGCLSGKTPALEQASAQPFVGLLDIARAASISHSKFVPSSLSWALSAAWNTPTPVPSLPLPIMDAPTISIHLKPQTLPQLPRTSPPSSFSLLTPEPACLWVWFVSSIQNTPFQLVSPFLQEALSNIPSLDPGPDAPSLCSHSDGDTPLILVPVARDSQRQTFSSTAGSLVSRKCRCSDFDKCSSCVAHVFLPACSGHASPGPCPLSPCVRIPLSS